MGMPGEDSDPDRYRHGDSFISRSGDSEPRLPDRVADAAGQRETAGDVSLRQQYDELLAALAERLVDLAHHATQPGRELGQDEIAGAMPVGVVHRLEVVEIKNEDAEGTAEA